MSAADRERMSSANTNPPTTGGPGDDASPEDKCSWIRKGSFEDYAFFFNPSRTASAVIGMWRTRTPTAL